MNEMTEIKSADKLVIEEKARQTKEFKKIGSYCPRIDGGSIYEYDIHSGRLGPAEYKKTDIFVVGGSNRQKLIVKKDCVYLEALNVKNAFKRLKAGKIIART